METGKVIAKVGGILDVTQRVITAPSTDPHILTIGQGQIVPATHGLNPEGPTRLVCFGAMGSGKTTVLAAWLAMHGVRYRNCCFGVIAPTHERLGIIWGKLKSFLRPSWIAAERVAAYEIELVNGVRYMFRSAKKSSEQVGSAIQGQDFVLAAIDEEQDIADEQIADVMTRGRSAPGGRYIVMSTATMKDTPAWRNRVDIYKHQSQTRIVRMTGDANPFVHPSYWEALRASLSSRQATLRIDAMDVRPDAATYPEFSRERHIIRLPETGNITPRMLAKFGDYSLLIGHDPGMVTNASVMLRCYSFHGRACWVVVGELTTKRTTTERHCDLLKQYLAKNFPDDRNPLIFADPQSDNSTGVHRSVYLQFRQAGFSIRSADPDNRNLRKDARIEMVNRLLLDAKENTRLYIATDANGNLRAPQLVAALEMSCRDASGKAEADKKDDGDLSHWPSALGYSLWPIERVRMNIGIRKGAVL